MAGAVGALGAAHTERRRLTFLTIPQAREVLATTDESSLLGRKVSAPDPSPSPKPEPYLPTLTLSLSLTPTRSLNRTLTLTLTPTPALTPTPTLTRCLRRIWSSMPNG